MMACGEEGWILELKGENSATSAFLPRAKPGLLRAGEWQVGATDICVHFPGSRSVKSVFFSLFTSQGNQS